MNHRQFCILDVIDQANDYVWKKRIWETIQNNMEKYDGFDSFSIQTVGRRVNTMKEEALLQETITHMDATNRGLLQVYELTEQGKKRLTAKRERRLRNLASKHMQTILGTGQLTVTSDQLENLFVQYFEIQSELLPERGQLQAMLDFLVDEFTDQAETTLDTTINHELKTVLAQESPKFSSE